MQLPYAAHAKLVKGGRTVWAPLLDPQVCVGAAGRRMADQAVPTGAPPAEGSAPLNKARERPSCLQLTLLLGLQLTTGVLKLRGAGPASQLCHSRNPAFGCKRRRRAI